jgi:hypothetical protein
MTMAGVIDARPGESADHARRLLKLHLHSLSRIRQFTLPLFQADSNNHALRKLDLSTGVVTTLAGHPSYGLADGVTFGGYADGAAVASLFNTPVGVAFDAASSQVIIVRFTQWFANGAVSVARCPLHGILFVLCVTMGWSTD